MQQKMKICVSRHVCMFRNRLTPGLLIFRYLIAFLVVLTPVGLAAHPSPNSLVLLDVNPTHVAMEVQLPLTELELAINRPVTNHPETLIERMRPRLEQYILSHIQVYSTPGQPWQVTLTGFEMMQSEYANTNVPYWELVGHLVLTPPSGQSTRHFFLAYDAIMHQVVTHTALLSIRSDWENGTLEENRSEAGVIRRYENKPIAPIEITLEQGSRWKGFASMFRLGRQHIQEGTDHLLFLLVLLLPSMLLVSGNKWGRFGGVKHSARHLLQIVTAFTIGHSITLLLSAAGWVQLPQQPVEILIAFSILVSAVHAIYPLFPGKEMYVATGFGLVHGLAFAAVLTQMKLSASTLAVSILGFNLGIEAMQLFIVLITVPWLILLSTTPVYKWVRVGGAALAALAALACIAERSLGRANWVTNAIVAVAPHSGWGILFLMLLSLAVYGWYHRLRGTAHRSTLPS
jgi:hypothetical protein